MLAALDRPLKHSDLRGCREHHEMPLVKDFRLKKDDQGKEYVTFEENRRKTRQDGLLKKETKSDPASLPMKVPVFLSSS